MPRGAVSTAAFRPAELHILAELEAPGGLADWHWFRLFVHIYLVDVPRKISALDQAAMTVTAAPSDRWARGHTGDLCLEALADRQQFAAACWGGFRI